MLNSLSGLFESIWLVSFNPLNETDRTDLRDQTNQIDRDSLRPAKLISSSSRPEQEPGPQPELPPPGPRTRHQTPLATL